MQHTGHGESPRPASVDSSQSNQSSTNLSFKGGKKGGGRLRGWVQPNDFCVGEELKIAVDIAIERFRLSEEQKRKFKLASTIFVYALILPEFQILHEFYEYYVYFWVNLKYVFLYVKLWKLYSN